MDLTKKWNQKNYQELIKFLFSKQDKNYAIFQQKLLKNDQIKVIGIRTPLLKKIALEIAENDYTGFISYNQHQYYEEVMLHGLVVTSLKVSFEESLVLFDEYILYINNWASCDLVISNYKLFSRNLELGFHQIQIYLQSDNPWMIRVGLVLLLNYYIKEDTIDQVLQIIDSIKNEDYYVKMANAWLLSFCLIKFYDKTILYLKHSHLDDWTYNKALQKGIESYRIIHKEEIRKLKRK